MPPFHALSDADVAAVAIVTKGANRKRIFLKKEHGPEAEMIALPGARPLIKSSGGADWSRFYCVVAEPGSDEDPGVLAKDQSVPDRWDEDEIRKAQASFARNGGMVNKMHDAMVPYGQLVENAIALADFTINGETVRKGSWYIAVEPTDEGREKIDKGEFTGVSIEGTATRTLVEKDAALVPDKPGINNWVDRAGGLPKFIGDIAGDLITEKGKSTSQAIQLAVGIVRRWCRGGGKVKPGTRAKACAAAAQWEAKKAAGSVAKLDAITVEEAFEAKALAEDPEIIEKAGRFEEQKHPRKGGKFAPKGTATTTSRPSTTPVNIAPGTDPARANRLKTASNILSAIGYKGQKLGDALRNFQKKNGLDETGEADAQTMVALRSKMAGRRGKQRSTGPGSLEPKQPKKQRGRLAPPKKKGRMSVKKSESPVWANVASR